MTATDPRHGTIAGYNRIPCHEDCCKLAMARYRKRWTWDAMNGRTRIVSSLGPRRRIEALMALGWSGHEIGRRLHMAGNNVTRLRTSTTMTHAMASRIAAVYDELSMTLPTGNVQAVTNVRNLAARRGYLPPLAWDDIDDPNERPVKGSDHRRTDDIDPVAVDRFLMGDYTLRLTRAEKVEVVRRWPGSLYQLEQLGWKPERYIDRQDGAA